ncbi:MAG: DUF308 domain-containing protein [Christensenellaceae bacterium]
MTNTERFSKIIISILLFAAAIVLFVIPHQFLDTVSFILGIIIAVYGIIKVIAYFFNRHNDLQITLGSLLSGLLTLAVGLILVFNPTVTTKLLEISLSVWMILMGLIKLLITYTYKIDKEPKWFLTLISALVSIVFGILIWALPLAWSFVLSVAVPIYFILLGVSNLLDFAFIDKKDRARIPLPLWLEAFLPQKILKTIKTALESEAAADINPDAVYVDGMEMKTDDIEVFVHMSERSSSAFGHVDIGFGDYVLSYGNYDHSKSAVKLFGLLFDGIFFICPRKEYIQFSIDRAGKTIMGYKLDLDEAQKKIVVENTMDFLQDCVPWSPEESDREINDYSWAIKDLGAHLFKVTRRKFKTYFVLNTNCALLSEVLLNGIKLPKSRAFGGIVTPGSAFGLYEKELARKGSLVVSKKIYLNNEMIEEIAGK